MTDSPRISLPRPLLFGVFVLSGISALIYQMVWQRALLMIFGSNVESVAMVVAAFLMGLGIGSLLGGKVSEWPRAPLVLCFGIAELVIGLYGIYSLRLFAWVDGLISAPGSLTVGVLAFALVFLPTLLMGSTLPLLVADQVRSARMVGEAVSWLYFVNTLGAALGAYIAVRWVLSSTGLTGAVQLAAGINAAAALIILSASGLQRWRAARS
jgi:predicted membrane-bound spermidine synthase